MSTRESVALDALTPLILDVADALRHDGRWRKIARVEATVLGSRTLAPLLAVEAALRQAGFAAGACELVWGWSSDPAAIQVRLRVLDAERDPMLAHTFALAMDATALDSNNV